MPNSQTAFVGGRVWTAGLNSSRELDLLVDDGRIAKVARRGELEVDEVGVVDDISGRLLVPGFQDAHAHPLEAGVNLLGCNLFDAGTAEEALARVAEFARDRPFDDWVIGGGWHRTLFSNGGPTRQQLDAVTGSRPAFFRSYDCHGAWVNTAALTAAGVDHLTPDPDNGRYVREPDGHPTGMLEEEAVWSLRAAMPPDTTETQSLAILSAARYLVSLGITSVQDAIVGGGFGMPDQIPAYRNLLGEDAIDLRLTTALWWDPQRGVEQIPELQAKRAELETFAAPDRLVADTVKLMVDGSHTVFIDAEATRQATVALDAAGFTCHYHSYGEMSTSWILDSIEEARQRNSRGGRHHIAHLMVVADQDFARFGHLDVTANLQAAWGHLRVHHDMMGLTTCSSDPHTREYSFARLSMAGARLAAGSDWPVSTPDPLETIRLAVIRGRERLESGATGPVDELDRLDLLAMFTAYTAGSAYVNGRAGSTGRIAPGFLADFAILDSDPFLDASALRHVAVDETWIGGTRRYQRETTFGE